VAVPLLPSRQPPSIQKKPRLPGAQRVLLGKISVVFAERRRAVLQEQETRFLWAGTTHAPAALIFPNSRSGKRSLPAQGSAPSRFAVPFQICHHSASQLSSAARGHIFNACHRLSLPPFLLLPLRLSITKAVFCRVSVSRFILGTARLRSGAHLHFEGGAPSLSPQAIGKAGILEQEPLLASSGKEEKRKSFRGPLNYGLPIWIGQM